MWALLMSFLRVPLFTLISYYLLLHFRSCKAYQNYLVASIKINTLESTVEIYGNMHFIEGPYCTMFPCKTYTVPEYGHSTEKHPQFLSDYDNVF